jgi:hypothetical protein
MNFAHATHADYGLGQLIAGSGITLAAEYVPGDDEQPAAGCQPGLEKASSGNLFGHYRYFYLNHGPLSTRKLQTGDTILIPQFFFLNFFSFHGKNRVNWLEDGDVFENKA